MFQVALNYQKISPQNYVLNNNSRISFKSKELKADVFEKSSDSALISFPVDDIPELNSKTMRLLYSPEFAPKRRKNEVGDYVTTIIDNKTQKPVEVSVVKLSSNNAKETEASESWGIFIDKDGEKERVGFREFMFDYKNKVISPGWMDSDGNSKYSGIGLRCHQIAVERMMQEGFDTVKIYSLPEAFPFHYKSGFRIIPGQNNMSNLEFQIFLDILKLCNGFSQEEIQKNLMYKINGDEFIVDNKTLDNFRKIGFMKGKTPILSNQFTMSLQGEWLETWKKMAKSQPILLDE